MKKFLFLSLTLVLGISLIQPMYSAAENNNTSQSGSGSLSGEELRSSTERSIVSFGSKKIDGYWWDYSSSWNSVNSSYDNNQPHSATAKADTHTVKVSTNTADRRVFAIYDSAGHAQYSQSVYYNYW